MSLSRRRIEMETTEITRVSAKARKSTDGSMWFIDVKCAHCGERHVHGAGPALGNPDRPDPAYFGRRVAHCGLEYFVESASK